MNSARETLAASLEGLLIPTAALFVSILLCGLFVALLGKDPFAVYHSMYRGGFAVRIIGGNARAARLAGLAVGRFLLGTFFLAGLAAGLAGAIEVAAIHGTANATLVAGYGYAGILVAFLARQNPLGVIPVSILLGGIAASGGLLQRSHNLPDATVLVLQGIVFIVILFSETLYGRIRMQPAPRV